MQINQGWGKNYHYGSSLPFSLEYNKRYPRDACPRGMWPNRTGTGRLAGRDGSIWKGYGSQRSGAATIPRRECSSASHLPAARRRGKQGSVLSLWYLMWLGWLRRRGWGRGRGGGLRRWKGNLTLRIWSAGKGCCSKVCFWLWQGGHLRLLGFAGLKVTQGTSPIWGAGSAAPRPDRSNADFGEACGLGRVRGTQCRGGRLPRTPPSTRSHGRPADTRPGCAP